MKARLFSDGLPITSLVLLGIIALCVPLLASFTEAMTADRLFLDGDARGEASLAIPESPGHPLGFVSDINRLRHWLGW